MGIITLGIGPSAPNITYLLTGGLLIGEPSEPTDEVTVTGTVFGPAATGIAYGPAATGSAEGVTSA